jgi:archaemetzincin
MNDLEKVIYLLQIGSVENYIFQDLRQSLVEKFNNICPNVKILEHKMSLQEAEYSRKRKQYNASDILIRLFNYGKDKHYFRILGVLDKDIYTRTLNFVFGVASPPRSDLLKNYGTALISVTRLRESFYGHPSNEEIFHSRILKEAMHELGHTFGLSHCKNECVMRFSNRLAETDNKPADFCIACTDKIERFLNKF